MSRVALVTGASSGIGRALALGLARRGYDLVLVGRNTERLSAAAEACRDMGRRTLTLSIDLSRPEAADAVTRALREYPAMDITVLVNNAGCGVHGPFAATSLDSERAMVELHVGALLGLTKALLPAMLKRGGGRILNVGSVYSMSPVEEQAVYAATKAFMLSFSQSLAAELRGSGVTVTALCPGVTRTEFRERAGIADYGRLSGMSAETVAEAGLDGLMAGRGLVVPGVLNAAFVILARLLGPIGAAVLVRHANRFRGLTPSRPADACTSTRR